ncbi:unnamed protein product [Pedinophyceae sp. YPF-701]|nr:unnamed protein product [Pedinophyceae sp. YPF-701]
MACNVTASLGVARAPVATAAATRAAAPSFAGAKVSLTSVASRAGAPVAAAPLRAVRGARAAARRSSTRVMAAAGGMNCLIVNTKGGGHAFIGLYLARALMAKGHKVTLMNDGDEAKLSSKGCYAQYPALAGEGATVCWGNPTDPSTYPAGDFDVVYDNNGKDIDTCKPLIDTYKGKVQHYVFVSSAGMLKASDVTPNLTEDDPRNEKAHYFVEEYLKDEGLPYTVMRPHYIYGEHTVKDCEQWFMDRILRDRPVPIPAPGTQLTSISHVEDVAEMLALVPGCEAAKGEIFQLCGDKAITFDGLVQCIAEAAGKTPKIVHYDHAAAGLAKGEGIPFRTGHFFSSNGKAHVKLGFKGKHTFSGDVKDRIASYIASGRLDKDVDFSADDKIIANA